MSPDALAEAAAGAVAAAAAAAVLWHDSTSREAPVRKAYRWFAAAAVAWGTGLITQLALSGPLGGTAVPLNLGDLLSLLALPAMAAGLVAMAAGREPSTPWPRDAVARLADGCLLAAALFIIAWVTQFGSLYHRSGDGAGTFALVLIHPLADLVALAVLLPYAVTAGGRAAAPFLALAAVAVSDTLAVGARVAAAGTGGWTQVTQLAAFCLLAAAPLIGAGPGRLPAGPARGVTLLGRRGQAREAGGGVRTLVAALAAAAAALVIIIWALAGGSAAEPAVAITGGIAVLALAIRTGGLLISGRAAAVTRQDSGRHFRELAERITDTVLVCDLDGRIRYASPAVAEYGYSPENLAGTALADLIHPEDLPGAVRFARKAAARGAAARGPAAARFPCRVRSSDGTWRHVESTVSRYHDPAMPDRLLVTARDMSDQVALRRQVTHLTFHDALTGLPNRAYLEERAKDALGGGNRAGAIFLDLDGFTSVNDSVGHGAGDLLLAQAARRLRAAVPPQDTVARWGGDEFAVLLEHATSAGEIVDIAERLAASITAAAFHVADRDVPLTASVGVALADTGDPADLLRNADVAMSRAKESGGGRVEVFAAHMHADVVRRLELASDLRRAITEKELRLDYQPVLDLATAAVTGAEALVRWWRAGEPVSPAEFLDVAEDSGLIVPLGDWVLREACGQAAAWRASGLAIGVSVNFSPRQVSAARFTETVLTALAGSGLEPGALTLEVAERVLIEGSGPMADGLAELRGRGIRLAIDDFGTGHASLAYLRRLPVDIIKIDPSFVAGLGHDPTLAMLTRTIVRVGRDLGIEVVAEGIERPEQLAALREMGCGLGQGFLLARPMAPREVEALAAAAQAAAASSAAVAPAEAAAATGPAAAAAGIPVGSAEGRPGRS